MKNQIEEAAQRLRTAEKNRMTCAPVRDLIGLTSLEDAYAVQELNTALRIKQGARVVGRKIGLTNNAIQQQLGVDQPDFGVLFDDREILNGGELSVREMMQPRIETEIAFVLGKDLVSDRITTVDVLSAIDYALVSLEVVGSRIEGWNIKITDTIADNASASHWVVGHKPVRLENLDLVNCKMEMTRNGELVSEGKGAACLGSPVNAMLWLARKLASLGQPMRAGEVILTGALGPMIAVNAGDHFNATIEGLGSVSATFTE